MDRIIGKYDGKQKGPLLIGLGGIHGNEPAGIEALELIFKMLEVEPLLNPEFKFKGRFLGLRGNLRAIGTNKRYIKKDLNRHWTPKNVQRIIQSNKSDLEAEDLEIREIMDIFQAEVKDYQPEQIVLLDLHTTTAYGGIFTVVTDDPESLTIGLELHAPVVKGLLEGIKGTTLHFFNEQNIGIPTTAVCFESGQHQEKLSVNRAIAAITNCMRTIGCVKAEHIENRHDKLLIEFSRGLPKVSQLILAYRIKETDKFSMQPGYKNFQPVKKGEIIASDKKGSISVIEDGHLLMPLYQKQGDDGFFLIKSVDDKLGI